MAAQPQLLLYTNPLAFHPAKAVVMLAESGLPHKLRKVDLLGGEALRPWFMRINPAAAVPALEKDGQIVIESLTICQLVDSLIPNGPLGGDKVDRAFVDSFAKEISAFDGNLFAFSRTPPKLRGVLQGIDTYRKGLAASFAAKNPDLKDAYEAKIQGMGKLLEEASDPAKVAACEASLTQLLDTAEARLTPPPPPAAAQEASGTPPAPAPPPEGPATSDLFLAGGAYSLVDALFAPILFRVSNMGGYKTFIAPRPHVAAYMKRMEQRPSWKAGFAEGKSASGPLRWAVPAILKSKLCNALKWY